MRCKDDIDKNTVVQALELRFIFLDRWKKLVISISTSYTTDDIEKSTILIMLRINI